jgi:hypothetical protein
VEVKDLVKLVVKTINLRAIAGRSLFEVQPNWKNIRVGGGGDKIL